MASARYKRIFLIRFLFYFSVLISLVWTIATVFPVTTAEFNFRRDQLLGVQYTVDDPEVLVTTSQGTGLLSGENEAGPSAGTGFSAIKSNVNVIKPASTDYGIVIEKINANAKIIPDVNPANEKQYTKALSEGVAASLGSTKPGEAGNLYIFSHSTDAPWNISRFNAIFYLLRELAGGDRIIVYYEGKRFDYIVFDKQVINPKDTSFLTNRYDQPVLTLQTCDPPGTLNNRLIVRAKLLGT